MEDNKNPNQEIELKEDELSNVAGGSRRQQFVDSAGEPCEPGDCKCEDECEEGPNMGSSDADPAQDQNNYEV